VQVRLWLLQQSTARRTREMIWLHGVPLVTGAPMVKTV